MLAASVTRQARLPPLAYHNRQAKQRSALQSDGLIDLHCLFA